MRSSIRSPISSRRDYRMPTMVQPLAKHFERGSPLEVTETAGTQVVEDQKWGLEIVLKHSVLGLVCAVRLSKGGIEGRRAAKDGALT